MTSVFERRKTVHASDCTATVIGIVGIRTPEKKKKKNWSRKRMRKKRRRRKN
jgi:hypothetical protein